MLSRAATSTASGKTKTQDSHKNPASAAVGFAWLSAPTFPSSREDDTLAFADLLLLLTEGLRPAMGLLEGANSTLTMEKTALDEKLPQGWHAKDFVTPSQDLAGSRSVMMDSTKILGVQVVLIAAYSLIILLGFIGNSLVIYIIVKYKTMRTVTNFFIANLALADLMVDTLCLPFTLVYTLLDEWKFGAVLCHLVPYAQALSVHVSILTLTVIALDRYRCIVFHLDSRISKRLSFTIITIMWLAAAVLAGPLAIFREYRYEEIPSINLKMAVCSEKWPSGNNRDATIYSLSMLLLQYVFPLAIICYAYTRIWFKLKNHVSPTSRNENQCRRRKTTKMLVMVVVVFAVCWLPFHIFQLAIDLDLVLIFHEYKLLYTVFHVGAMCSTFVNPLLYGWMNKNYRNGFLMFFRCQNKPERIHTEGSVRGRSYIFRTNTLNGSMKQTPGNGPLPTEV
ncbi:neuropeptide Y receptor type 2 [Patagioenas fasciata monilis]|uniref:Neuropeptide Y receptor type 2 n=1 Tax=Patagioenas fasciata monilis TaxID=372326 RepID=A0A1V4KUV7_PATFA|nr:neuropeptide Y receptor type 2 [Patagioenas fasciata monilis]